MKVTSILATLALSSAAAQAVTVDIDFLGNGGVGLLPSNEIGMGTSLGSNSTASGGEAGAGLSFDTDSNILTFDFDFQGLGGGLFDAATGIHLHLAGDANDPFNTNGGIVFNLNSGMDANVTLSSALIATDGTASSGRVTGTAQLTEAQQGQLFGGQFYLNIHSDDFRGGELRANLVPEPSSALLSLCALGGLMVRRRR